MQCGAVRDRSALFRIAGRPGKGWAPDPGGKLPGRGIYLCPSGECMERFAERIRTPRGGARWKMGADGKDTADRLMACRKGGPKS